MECATKVLVLNKIENTKQERKDIKCLKCDQEYNLSMQKDDYLAHLYMEHHLVIADVKDIAILEDYLEFWQNEFEDAELEEYCTTMLLDQLPDGTVARNEKYFLLSDVLPKDYELRRKLRKKHLEQALTQHQFELTDRTFEKECLYCRDVIKGLRADYLEHLFQKHYLQLGKPENLVYIDELLEKVQNNLGSLICLYCDKIFKDRVTLKEHMRKKGHKRINDNNTAYDKYFLQNYRYERIHPTQKRMNQRPEKRNENGQCEIATVNKNSKVPHQNEDTLSDAAESRHDFERLSRPNEDSDSDWSDWDGEDAIILHCLYCTQQESDFTELKKHMNEKHRIDFDAIVKDMNFYQKIKMINFVRRQVFLLHCITCDMRLESSEQLLQHMDDKNHFSLGTEKQWNKPEYFFPTYEDDGLLCVLDDNLTTDINEPAVRIITEDNMAQINKDAERLSLDNFKF